MKLGDCHAARRPLAARNDTDFVILSDVLSEGQASFENIEKQVRICSSGENLIQSSHTRTGA
jgi:hypothetical protein